MRQDQGEDRRRHARVEVDLNASLIVEGQEHPVRHVANLSVGGCLLATDYVPAAETPCRVRFDLTGVSEPMAVEVSGLAIRSHGGKLAVNFDEIDLDDLFRLQKLAMMNADDPDTVDEEIRRHPGVK